MKEGIFMTLDGKNIGFAMTGSFCTFEKAFIEMKHFTEQGANVLPIFSYSVQNINCRFGNTEDFKKKAYELSGHMPITTLEGAEPIGPKNLIDILIIAPCTGNTVAKLVNAITDTPVLMAAKSHLRNNKPVVISLATNDALGMNLKNIGALLHCKNIYFVPFGQDDFQTKPNSMIAHTALLTDTVLAALDGRQLQPILQNWNV